jgi:mycothiol synthase
MRDHEHITPRPYRDVNDLSRVLGFAGECNALTGCGYAHPGDIGHNLSNLLRGQDPGPYLHLWEDGDGHLLAVAMLYPPRYHGYELVVHPHHRGGELESAPVAWSERHVWALMQSAGVEGASVGTDVADCDPVRRDVLLRHGYISSGEPSFFYTVRSLLEPLPDSVLPEGFVIRSAAGEYEADALGDVHSGAFGSHWPPGDYLRVMRSPAYDMDRELVVVAPDGRLAAFLVYWIDPVSRSGLFEPVGCHSEFQGRGLAKALMHEGLRRMRARGMTTAVVKHENDNPAAAALYASVGFRTLYTLAEYRKAMR